MRWLVDAVLLLAAVAFGLVVQQDLLFADGATQLSRAGPLDLAAGAVCLSSVVWLRRPAPVLFTLLGVAVSTVSTVAGAIPLMGAFAVAAYRRRSVAFATTAVVALNAGVLQPVLHPLPEPTSTAFGGVLIALGATGWGMYAGSRRRVLELLRAQVADAERVQAAREGRARAEERTRLAHEMHDGLAHRLSLLAVHGGALAFRADRAAPEVGAMAEVVREQAHRALDDLRTVITVLREDDPRNVVSPGVDALPDLVAENVAAGLPVTLAWQGTVGPTPGTIVFRVVQEALTNSRRHGHGRAVEVVVRVDDRIRVCVTEHGAPDPAAPVVGEGAGMGLRGLAERVEAAGGRFESGPGSDGGFRVTAELPP